RSNSAPCSGLLKPSASCRDSWRKVQIDLDCVLVAANRLLDYRSRNLRLLQKALGRAPAEIDHRCANRSRDYLGGFHEILNHVKLERVLPVYARCCDANADRRIRDVRAENGYFCFVGRCQYPVFGGYLGQFSTQEVQKLPG